MSDPIRLERKNDIAELILNVPERRNALSSAMWSAIPGLVREAEADRDIRILIIHGGKAGAFAAGADISEFETIYATPESAARASDAIAAALNSVEACRKPVLAAIEGACVGGGVSLALACDLRIASAGARFAITPGKLGLVYPFDDTRRLVDTVGAPAARDILYTGRLFEADEAYRLRLIDRLCGKGEALETARILAGEIGALSQWSVRASKQMIARVLSGQRAESAETRAVFVEGVQGEDFQEGYRAFVDKRPARFSFR